MARSRDAIAAGSDRRLRSRPCPTAPEQLDGDPDLTIEPLAVRGRGFGYFSYPAAADGTVLRVVDVYTVRDGLIVAKDVLGQIV
ncbi:hypothetical protein [Actinoplanes auranticolor]|uniref:Uncharacterized protein n=1 Tax=Actinoplanes auranticolor TaxID=47988 RepID=A0A919S5Y2_9ACTN|nr:hypothetical protein [Actinoplanes auranticolor]GIM64866.1 hypothetical protein Aau02nite_13210 [Actinoplanes auranticolor]